MMILFTDTDTDFTPIDAEEYGFKLIHMPYSFLGQDYFAYEEFPFDSKAYYDILRSGVVPTSAALNSEEYKEYFEPYLKMGEDILYIHFSRAMTVSFDNMDIAIKELKELYPERTIYTIDTKAITILSYVIVKEIGKMYKNGATLEEIMAWAEKEIGHFAVYFYADNLTFFKHSGRVSGIAATMGNIFGIRPIIHINDEGKMVNIGKAKGKKAVIDRLLSYVDELGDNIGDYTLAIAHCDYLDEAKKFGALLEEKYGKLDIDYVCVNPVCGAHCGPDAIGVSFRAKHR